MSTRPRTLSQLPVSLRNEIADLMSREQQNALQELLTKETRPVSEMSTWPPNNPRGIIEALGGRTVDSVREIFVDVGLDDAVPLLEESTRRSRPQTRPNMMSRSIANGYVSLSEPASSSSSSSSNLSSSSSSNSSSSSTSNRVVQESNTRTSDDPIVIDEQPIPCPVRLGGTAAFYVGASCPLHHRIIYQWFKSKRIVEGAISEKLIIENVVPDDRNVYTCRLCIKELNFYVFTDWCELVILDLPEELANDHPLTRPTPPGIIKNPQSKEVVAGEDVTFNVEADGVPEPTFQWYKNGVLLEGETSKQLKLQHVESQDSGSYCCSVENEKGSVLTNTALLRVQTADPLHPPHADDLPTIPVISLHPQSMEVTEGSRIQLRCYAIAKTPVHYNWYKNGQSLQGSGDILTFPSAQLADSGHYSCRVFTQQGYDNLSQLAHVEVVQRSFSNQCDIASTTERPSFYILAQPRNVTVKEGDDAVFTCHAESTIKMVTVEYQWYRLDGLPLTEKSYNAERLVLSNVKLSDNNITVYCRISDEKASAKSNLAHLMVKAREHSNRKNSSSSEVMDENAEVCIVEQPVSVTAQLGSRVTLDCRGEGPGKLTYQWCKIDAPGGLQELFSSDRSALTLYSLSKYNSGKYICKVRGANGATTMTNPAEVTVIDEDANSTMAADTPSDNLMPVSAVSSDLYPFEQQSIPQSVTMLHYANSYEGSPHSFSPVSPDSCPNPMSLPSTGCQRPAATPNYVNVDDLVRSCPQSDDHSIASHSSTLTALRREMAQCSFSKQPESQELAIGDTLRLTVEAAGFPIPSYCWYKDDKLLSTTSKVLVTKGVKVNDGGIYHCEAVNEMGVVRSEDAFVKVKDN